METATTVPMRSVIVITLVVCLAVAIAPWMSGGQEPLAMLISGAALLLGALLVWRQPEARQMRVGPLMLSWLALMALALVSLVWSANRYSTMIWVSEWTMAGLAFWMAFIVAGEAKGRELMTNLYLVSAGLFSISALWIFLTQDYERLTGTFYWANPAAAYLIPAVVLGVDRMRLAGGRVAWGWAGATGLFLATFLLTDSRAATLVLLIVLVVYCLVTAAKRWFWIKLLFVIVIGVGVSLGLSWLSTYTTHHSTNIVPGSRFAEAAKGESQSVNDRFQYLKSAVAIWADHPFLGTGAGTYGDVHPGYQGRVVSASSSAHNAYLQVLPELGIVGVLFLLSVLVWLFAGVLRGMVRNPETVPMVLGVAGLLMHFGLDIDATYPSLLVLAAVLLGLVYRQWEQGRGVAGWRGAAVAALLLVPLASLYKSDTWAIAARSFQDDNDYAGASARFATAHSGLVYNPDLLGAEGIDWYTEALGGGKSSRADLDMALNLAHQAEKADPNDGQHHQLEGRILVAQGNFNGAEAALHEALRLDPYDHPQYALDLANLQVQQGNSLAAMATAQAMLAQYPPSVVANRSADATLAPALANLEALVGNLYMHQGKMGDAQQAANRAMALDSKSIQSRALMRQLELKEASSSHQ